MKMNSNPGWLILAFVFQAFCFPVHPLSAQVERFKDEQAYLDRLAELG